MKEKSDLWRRNGDDEIPDDSEHGKFITADDRQSKKTEKVIVSDEMDTFPKDRGWAWIILLGATLDMLLLIGIIKCSGILFVAFQERFQSSSSMTSLLSTVQNICQSATSLLAMTCGIRLTSCRIMLFIGSVITCVAYVITSQAGDIRLLLLSHGILQGIGMGLMFPTAVNMVSLYFEKRRGFANSVAVSGGSIGGLIFAPLITNLLTTYGYQGCLLTLAGLLLNGCVIATLLRPTSFYTQRKRIHHTYRQHQKIETKKLLPENNDSDTRDKQLDHEKSVRNMTENTHESRVNVSSMTKHGTAVDNIKIEMAEQNKRSYSANDISMKRQRRYCEPYKVRCHIGLKHDAALKLSLFPNSSEKRIFKPMEMYVERSLDTVQMPVLPFSPGYDTEDTERFCKQKQLDVEYDIEKMPETLPVKSKKQLLFNPVFWAILLQASLICSGTLVAPIFIAPYAKDIGVTSDEVATLVTALSCVDLFSRIAVGYISDKGWLRRSSIVGIATLVISISANLLRFYTSYGILIGYAIVLGMVSGAYFSLYTVVIIDYLTLDNFQTCLGIVALVHGFSTAGVFYLVGVLRDTTGSYVIPHNVIGVSTGVGAIILFLLPVIERLER